MKKLEAIVEPSEVEVVKEGLTGMGIGAFTVTEVRDFGACGGRTLVYRGVRFDAPYVVEAKVEVVVGDDAADRAVTVLEHAAKADGEGQKRVCVITLDDASRLKTAKKSVAAL